MKDLSQQRQEESADRPTFLVKNLSEISLEEEKMMDGPVLSANAQPFEPRYAPSVNIAIFNDGVPSLTLTSESDLSKILHGIQDDALDEGFPPDAQDAAELEAVEAFVETMADLAHLEEREEAARTNFAHVKKRWEARRSDGLVGRPHAAKHLVYKHSHNDPTLKVHPNGGAAGISSLIHYSHAAQRMFALGDKMRIREFQDRSEPRHAKKMNWTNQHKNPIQQPRKQN